MIQVVEQLVQGKSPNRLCEDIITVTPHFCAVIDGSTSKGTRSYGGKSTGRLAAEQIDNVIKDFPAEISLCEAVRLLTESIRIFYQKNKLEEDVRRHPENRLTASVAIYSDYLKEIWLIGDCQCRFAGQTYTNSKETDKVLAEIRSDINRFLLTHGHTTQELAQEDLGRKFIWDALKDQCVFQNVSFEICPYGYTVIDGFAAIKKGIKVLSVREEAEVILASDGYTQLADNMNDTEICLQKTLEENPLLIEPEKSTKGLMAGARSFDDRSYLRFKIT